MTTEKEHHSWKLHFVAMALPVSLWDLKMLQIFFRSYKNISTEDSLAALIYILFF